MSVIDTATNTVIGSPIPVGGSPYGVAVTPDGSKVYVTNDLSNTVSVIDTTTNTVIGTPIRVDVNPFGVAVTPDGSKVYVTNVGFPGWRFGPRGWPSAARARDRRCAARS